MFKEPCVIQGLCRNCNLPAEVGARKLAIFSFPSRMQERISTVDFASDPDLFNLKYTGFNSSSETNAFFLNARVDSDQALEVAADNLRGYWQEYLARLPFIPNNNVVFREDNGIKKIVSSRFPDRKLEDLIFPEERNGATLSAVRKTVEYLKTAEPGDLVFWVSPMGPAQWYIDGEEVIYPDTQTYVYSVGEDGKLIAFTIVSDMTLEEVERLWEDEGYGNVFMRDQSLQNRLEMATDTVIFKRNTSPEYVVSQMEKVMGREYLHEGVTFQELREMIEDREALEEADETTEELIANFKDWVKKNIKGLSEEEKLVFKTELSRVAIKITYLMRHPGATRIDYQEGYRIMQSIGGCAGGGQSPRRIMTSGEKKFVRQCGICGAPINTYISAGYVCISCGQKYLGIC